MEKLNVAVEENVEINKTEPKKEFKTFISSFHMAILGGLQGKSMYAGTVDYETIQKRRARNKMAKASRRKNRA